MNSLDATTFSLSLLFFLLAPFLRMAAGQLVTETVTIDDANSNITYTTDPNRPGYSRWTAVNVSNGVSTTCNPSTSCVSSDLDPNQVIGGTWHEGSDTAWATVQFQGISTTVYFVFRDFGGTITNVSFLIDGQHRNDLVTVGTAQTQQWEYNYPAFKVQNLSDSLHTLKIQGGSPNLFVLDYITYERVTGTDATSTSSSAASATETGAGGSSSKSSTPIIVGSAIAATGIVVALIIAVALFMRRRQRRRSIIDLTVPQPAAEMEALVSPYTEAAGPSGYHPNPFHDSAASTSTVDLGGQKMTENMYSEGVGRPPERRDEPPPPSYYVVSSSGSR